MAEANIPGMGLLYFSITGEEDAADPPPPPGYKRRRLRGACAECRHRKIRCDRAKQAGGVCSNCIAFNCPCTDPRGESVPEKRVKSKAPAASSSRSETSDPNSRPYGDKTAAEHVETIVVQSTAYIPARDLRGILLDVAQYSRALEDELKACRAQLQAQARIASRAPSTIGTDGSASSPRSIAGVSPDPEGGVASVKKEESDALIEDFQGMKLTEGGRTRYFGESSGQHLFRTAEVFKQQHEGEKPQVTAPVRRLQFWKSPWEKAAQFRPPVYTFPAQDLIESLTDLYFMHWNILIPLLHRPTFERSIASGLHLTDQSFGAVVLGVCALGSRFSDDPRVLVPGTDTKLSAGWDYIQQIRYPVNPDFYFTLSLHGLQQLTLSTLYLQHSSTPQQCWTFGSIGLRNIQDVGRHRQKRYPSSKPELTVEDELYRRVVWSYIVGDVYMSAFLGRPRATSEDDYDIDYPTDCDDEYWENPDPAKRFVQPSGKPSQISYFVAHLKLLEILGRAEGTIYSLRRHTRGSEWSQETVVELDSELNEWLHSIPDHLRWDPHREKSIFATQSACLYAAYYHVQIQIHRSFIPSPSNDAPLFSSFPSLAICSNAARACSHVMEVQARNGVFILHPQGLSSLMDSALVLLVNVWAARRSGSSMDPQRAAVDIQRCISCIKAYEPRLQLAGRFCDLLASISHQVLVDPPAPLRPPQQLKRAREPEQEQEVTATQLAGTMAGSSSRYSAPASSPYTFGSIPTPAPEHTPDPTLSALGLGHGHGLGFDFGFDVGVDVNPLMQYNMPMSTEQLGGLPTAAAGGPMYDQYDWAMGDAALMADVPLGMMFSFADVEAGGVLTGISRPGRGQGAGAGQSPPVSGFYPGQTQTQTHTPQQQAQGPQFSQFHMPLGWLPPPQ